MARHTLANLAHAHPTKIHNLPKQPEHGYHGLPDPITIRFADAGLLEQNGYCRGTHPNCDTENECRARIWTLTEKGKQTIENIDKPNTLPCNHAGIHTLPNEKYTCLNDDCNKTYSREVAENVEL